MINTVSTKEQQLKNGFFKIGNGSEVILIIGSCRSVPYVNYFLLYNSIYTERYTIIFIDPFNWNFDLNDNRTDFESVITSLESDERILTMLKTVDIFIHEYYSNFGMFNCSKSTEKNIYKFGLSPKVDVCIPNFNDNFILFSDIVTFNTDIRKQVQADYNVLNKLSSQTQEVICKKSFEGVQRFYEVCLKSDIPEMKIFFEQNYKKVRLFHTYNHVSSFFTLKIFGVIIEKYLKYEHTLDLLHEASKLDDLFATPNTKLTEYDYDCHKYEWIEPTIELKSKL